MDWRRAKTVLIIAFLALNAMLSYQLWQDWRHQLNAAAGWTSLPSETQQAMRQKQIRLDAAIPTHAPELKELTFAFHSKREDAGPVPIDPPRDTRIVFLERELRRELGRIIPELESYEFDPAAGRDGVFVFNRMADGWPLFGVQLELHYRNQKITAYRQDRIRIFPSDGAPARKVLPAAQAVANLIEKYLPKGAVVKDIRLGYHGQIFDAETQVAAPTWRVLLEDGEVYYIHAISGEVSAGGGDASGEDASGEDASGGDVSS
jgi:regulatory protein YycI of two-component signal transduction system YycFG